MIDEMREHAAKEYPRECCGVVIIEKGRQKYVPCRNIAERSDQEFVIDPADWAAAEDRGEIVEVVHSHPDASATPSEADKTGCERSGLPWSIVSWPGGALHTISPQGYRAPFVGRPFSYGVLDCYQLIRDYYQDRLNIILADVFRVDEWWLRGQDLFRDRAAEIGFHPVTDKDALQAHDVILMQVGSTVPNHGAIWLGDGTILHHQMDRLSSRDVFGGWFKKIHVCTYRHEKVQC